MIYCVGVIFCESLVKNEKNIVFWGMILMALYLWEIGVQFLEESHTNITIGGGVRDCYFVIYKMWSYIYGQLSYLLDEICGIHWMVSLFNWKVATKCMQLYHTHLLPTLSTRRLIKISL